MDKTEKVKALAELFELMNSYYVGRDIPLEGVDFFDRLEACCESLELSCSEVKREFQLLHWKELY